METENKTAVTPIESEQMANYASFSHQKGEVQMITTTKDKLESLLSSSGSLNSNFLSLMIGTAITIFMALKSGGIEESWRAIFWVALMFSGVLIAYFGYATFRDELRKRRLKNEIIKVSPTNIISQETQKD